jgi:sugar phosphate isomerase/epimerase
VKIEGGETMRIGIDTACYHRYFGDSLGCDFQNESKTRWTYEDLVNRATKLKVDALSLETCWMSSLDIDYIKKLRGLLSDKGLSAVWSWGHSIKGEHGLKSSIGGKEADEALKDAMSQFEKVKAIGANVMRITGGGQKDQPKEPQIARLIDSCKKLADAASSYGIKLGLENHVDYTSDEILRVIEKVDSQYFGSNFDSGNCLRVYEDPVRAAEKLGPYAVSTHMKDIGIAPRELGLAPKDWNFWMTTALGEGLVDLPKVLTKLRDAGYKGNVTIEIDVLKGVKLKDNEEDMAVQRSVEYLRKIEKELKW